MATDRTFVAYVLAQAQLGDALVARAMFGEYGLSLDGRRVTLICDNSLYVKATPATETVTAALPRRAPYPGAKPHAVADELLDDGDALRSLLQDTARALPPAKPRAPRTPRTVAAKKTSRTTRRDR